MVFSSIPFLYFFLPLVLLSYFIVPGKFKNVTLLVFSLLFYWWGEPKYALLMLFTITFCYGAGLLIENRRSSRWCRLLLIFSVAVPIGLLALFKYADFIIKTASAMTGADLPLLKLALPIGISFYTFQALSYVVDVYRGDVRAQRNWIDLACYVTLFPQLIAGPIVRYSTVAQELKTRKTTLSDFSVGVRRFVTGLGKKVLIANLLGEFCTVYRESQDTAVLFAWLYAIAFSLQIYFDFSAYSDMAIGLGRVFGFHFDENFNYPYISKSITEFWRRWHISLGTWFRDYLYIPLGGNRVKIPRHIFNIFVVWALTGLWHGAAWNFVAWGSLYGLLLIIEKYLLKNILEKTPSLFRHIGTLVVVMVGWVLFSQESFTAALEYIKIMFGMGGASLYDSTAYYYLSSAGLSIIVMSLSALGFFVKMPRVKKFRVNVVSMIIGYTFVFLLCIIYLISETYNPFLYFRF